MENRSSVLRFLALALLIGASVSSPAAAETIERDFHESFEVNPGMALKLKHGDGDVTVTPWDRDTLDVVVRYRAKIHNLAGWSKHNEIEVTFKQEGDTIYVVGTDPSLVSVGISSFREIEYTYTVQAPDYLDLELIGEDGDVSISNWQADLDLRSEDGDLMLRSIKSARTDIWLQDGDLEIFGITGELRVEAEDGDLEIHDCVTPRGELRVEDGDIDLIECSGRFDIEAEDGDVRLSRVSADELEVRVSDGSVYADLLPVDDVRVAVRASDGNINVDLDEGMSAMLDLTTRDGRIRVDSPQVSDLHKERRRVTGRLGDGSGSINIASSDGNITLRQ